MTQEQAPNWDEIKRQLAAPFHAYYVGWKAQATTRDKTRALAVPYVDARTVMDRLDQAAGPENWSDSYRLVSAGDGEFAVECTLTLFGVSKADVGTADERSNGSSNHRLAAPVAKSAYSDALKRAAVRWGVGRYLHRVHSKWVRYDAAEKQLAETPRLPEWALPEDGRSPSESNGNDGNNGHRGRAPANGSRAMPLGTPATVAAHTPLTTPGSAPARGNGKNGSEMSLDRARATVLSFGTRDHPEWKGKSLAEVSTLSTELIVWLANEFNPTSKGGRTVQEGAKVIVEHARTTANPA